MQLKKVCAKLTAAILTLLLAGANLSPALAATTQTQSATGTTVQISVDDLRQVTVYTEALEAELKTANASLESERAAVEKLIAEQQQERCSSAAYAETLQAELTAARAATASAKRGTIIRNITIAALLGAVAGLIASR